MVNLGKGCRKVLERKSQASGSQSMLIVELVSFLYLAFSALSRRHTGRHALVLPLQSQTPEEKTANLSLDGGWKATLSIVPCRDLGHGSWSRNSIRGGRLNNLVDLVLTHCRPSTWHDLLFWSTFVGECRLATTRSQVVRRKPSGEQGTATSISENARLRG